MTDLNSKKVFSSVLLLLLLVGFLIACDSGESEQEELQSELTTARDELETTRERLGALDSEIVTARAESQNLRQQAVTLEEANQVRADDAQGVEALRSRIVALENDAATFAETQAELDEAFGNINVEIGRAKDQVQGAQSERDVLLSQLAEAQAAVAQGGVRLQEAREAGVATLTLTQNERTQSLQEAELLRVQGAELAAQIAEQREQLRADEAALAQAQTQVAQLVEQQASLVEGIERTRREVETRPSAAEVEQLYAERSDAVTALETLRTELNARPRREQLNAYSRENAALRAQLEGRPDPQLLEDVRARTQALRAELAERPTPTALQTAQARARTLQEQLEARPTAAELAAVREQIRTLELQLNTASPAAEGDQTTPQGGANEVPSQEGDTPPSAPSGEETP